MFVNSLPSRNGLRFNNGLVIPGQDLTYIPIPKSASSSVMQAIFRKWRETTETIVHVDRITTSRAVSLWREPTERAWSSYKYVQHTHPLEWHINSDGDRYYPDVDLPWDEFLYELAMNRHRERWLITILPQNEFCKARTEHIMVPWDFERLAEILTVPEILHSNPGKNPDPMPDITPEMQFHLNIIYGADYRIWDLIA